MGPTSTFCNLHTRLLFWYIYKRIWHQCQQLVRHHYRHMHINIRMGRLEFHESQWQMSIKHLCLFVETQQMDKNKSWIWEQMFFSITNMVLVLLRTHCANKKNQIYIFMSISILDFINFMRESDSCYGYSKNKKMVSLTVMLKNTPTQQSIAFHKHTQNLLATSANNGWYSVTVT